MIQEKQMQDLKKAKEITLKVKEFAKQLIKPEMKLLEIAEKIENKIKELGGKPSFPTNLGINEIAAHYTPSYNDETTAKDLLKVDFGVNINGMLTDTAFSLDLSKDKKYEKLIEASKKALENAEQILKKRKEKNRNIQLKELGKTIQETITNYGFSPIKNLSGHEISEYNLHAGITIPNYDNGNPHELKEGIYAIEPFATTGTGIVKDSKPSGIYKFEQKKGIRDSFARKVLEFIEQEYKTLPFCQRWIVNKFGTRSLISLKQLEQAKILHHFKTLVESSKMPVSQAENTFLITEKEIKVLSE